MKNIIILSIMTALFTNTSVSGGNDPAETFGTASGPLKITFHGHSSLLVQWAGHTVYVDPWGKMTDYSDKPVAGLILVTHEHTDHYDPGVIGLLSDSSTMVICNAATNLLYQKGYVLKNGESYVWNGIGIKAVPAYNITPDRTMYHPKGRDNGYVLHFGDFTLYIAGDTENTTEMKALENIDVAILPMNQPYTMTPEQVIDAAGAIRPKILIPCHTNESSVEKLRSMSGLLQGIDLRTPVKD